MLNFENLEMFNPICCNTFEVPEIKGIERYTPCEWIPFNYAMTCKNPKNKAIHFFLDDYQFIRVWNTPKKYIPILKQFKYVLSPDFSMYLDMPKALWIYNHYRRHWMGAYMELHGIDVIPTISWSDESSFDWCFDGDPVNSIVAISSVGCMKRKDSKDAFLKGYEAMKEHLTPKKILCYGKPPEEIKNEVIVIPSFTQVMKERIKNGR